MHAGSLDKEDLSSWTSVCVCVCVCGGGGGGGEGRGGFFFFFFEFHLLGKVFSVLVDFALQLHLEQFCSLHDH